MQTWGSGGCSFFPGCLTEKTECGEAGGCNGRIVLFKRREVAFPQMTMSTTEAVFTKEAAVTLEIMSIQETVYPGHSFHCVDCGPP